MVKDDEGFERMPLTPEEVPMFLIDTLLRSLAYGRLRLKLLDIALQLFQPNLSERRQLSVAPRWRDVLHDADT